MVTVQSDPSDADAITTARVLAALQDVKDPEIPVVSVVELGIVQDVTVDDDGRKVTVAITPTFTGCPALDLMRAEIAERVRAIGAEEVEVPVVLHPPWSSDRIAPAARERMRSIGLAPPPPSRSRFEADITLSLREEPVRCPFCGSTNTAVENPFGPTICRSLHYCYACQQPFEQFKAL
jgi:ring-1,2-phenylacetyl-CoA epoxidase subunit PaaD